MTNDEAYQAGHMARLRGDSLKDNPFQTMADSWAAGWADQHHHLMTRNEYLRELGWFNEP